MTTVDINTDEKQMSLADIVVARGGALVLMACMAFWMSVGTALYFIF